MTGAAGFCWSIWLTRNDRIFDKSQPKKYLYVRSDIGPNCSIVKREKTRLYKHVASWRLQQWLSLHPMDDHSLLGLALVKGVYELCDVLCVKLCNKFGLIPLLRG